MTENPTAVWTAQQIVEAFAWETPPRFLQRDRDKIYGEVFRARVRGLGLEELMSAPRSPRQNGYVERMIGTIRRKCLDHVLVISDKHLRRVLSRYLEYYHRWRPHGGLDMDASDGRSATLKTPGWRQLELPFWKDLLGPYKFFLGRDLMVTDEQVRLLMKKIQTEKTLAVAAAKAGMDEKTARRYRDLGRLPSEVSAITVPERPGAAAYASPCSTEYQPSVSSLTSITSPIPSARAIPDGRIRQGRIRTPSAIP